MSLYINEYSNVENGIPVVPPVAQQTIAVSGTSTQSAEFDAATNYVEVISDDGDVAIQFGTDPTASFGGPDYLPNMQRKLYRVPNAQGFKLAVAESD
jgi:hypothetical protein